MIRRVQLNIGYANRLKLLILDDIFTESCKVINDFVVKLWEKKDFRSKFVTDKVETWLSARMQQCLGKQALEMVKSQRRKRKKVMPVFEKNVINLDSRFVDVRVGTEGEFDIWVRLSSIGDKIVVKLPSRQHKHFFRYFNDPSWEMKKSCRLRREGGHYFIDLYFDRSEEVPAKETGSQIGLDCGYKKLLIDSNGVKYDVGMEAMYQKISRKKQGSVRFRRALRERDQKINQSLNSIDFNNLKTIVVEDLKDVKKDVRKKRRMSKKFVNKLQRWSYPKVLDKLSRMCEEIGITFIRVDPRYTSQTCSACGVVDKASRSLERFRCTACGHTMDADHNAAINILRRGVYSHSTAQ